MQKNLDAKSTCFGASELKALGYIENFLQGIYFKCVYYVARLRQIKSKPKCSVTNQCIENYVAAYHL
jgi:hypothetical protein